METSKKILIIGGTGMLGREFVRQLLPSGDEVHVMTRTPQKCVDLSQSGVHVMGGDLIDKSSLLVACKGMDVVIATAHSVLGRGKYDSTKVDDQGHRDLIDAARENGVKYFIYTSGIGARTDSPSLIYRLPHCGSFFASLSYRRLTNTSNDGKRFNDPFPRTESLNGHQTTTRH